MASEPHDDPASRRGFLRAMGAVAGAALPSGAVHSATQAAARVDQGDAPGHGERSHASAQFFTLEELSFVEAALAVLIPKDELGPGAREAGVAWFIDRQLASPWGVHARQYRQGPWVQGTPEQGYQLPLTPQQTYRSGIAETNQYCRERYGARFDELDEARREETLKALESDSVALESQPSGAFFAMLWGNTVEGFFADPMYGGNRDKAGWRLIGFPGVAAAYVGEIERHNHPYRVIPVSIEEVRQGLVPVDAHGHPRHVPVEHPAHVPLEHPGHAPVEHSLKDADKT